MHAHRTSLPLRVAAIAVAALALGPTAPRARAAEPGPAPAGIAALRALGPAALPPLLARWDALPPGAARDRLELEIDAVAGQRYATVSRLYWYTDLDAARAAARAAHRPILALRMLGRLDEDLSCANSRFFRATLYANAAVSQYLREHFILYWSSERPVPRVTIDYGDGRRIVRTTTGNSAHYVLDETGSIADVLPGLYAPQVFQAELARSEALARRLAGLTGAARAAALAQHHQRERAAGERRFAAAAGTAHVRGPRRLLAADEIGASAVARAQRATMAKAIIETVELARIGIDAGSVAAEDVAAWATIGQRLWAAFAPAPAHRADRARPPRVLDAPSQALVARLYEAGPVPASRGARAAMLDRLEQSLVADTALNELRLRPQIRAYLIGSPGATIDQLNAWIYAHVFHTPRADPWLGLLPRTDFTGLPGDGAAVE